jgi:hypothetical protein
VVDKLLITEDAIDPELTARIARFRRNGEWLTAQGGFVFESFPGKYVAVSEGEVFIANDASEAARLALEKHPDDQPFVQFIPRESRERIYAY